LLGLMFSSGFHIVSSKIPISSPLSCSIAAAQNTTVLLARPNDKFSDMPRHPEEVDAPSLCVICNKDNGEEDSPLECDKCDAPYHLRCLDPPLDAVPEGEWFCPGCEDDPGAPVGKWAPPKRKKTKAKSKSRATAAKRSASGEDSEEMDTGKHNIIPLTIEH
jgi:hypothetical protein